MPAADVTVNAVFEEKGFEISAADNASYMFIVDGKEVSSAKQGESVTVMLHLQQTSM